MKSKLVIIITSLIGGFLGSLIFVVTDKVDKEILRVFLDWPFLGFIMVIFISLLFKDSISGLIKGGNIKVKYGDTEVSIEQLPNVIEQEIDNKIDLSSEEQVEKSDDSHLQLIKGTFKIQSDDLALLIFYLGSTNHKWRNLRILSKRTGLESNKIEQTLKAYPNKAIRGVGATGNVIYKLTDSAKQLYEEKVKNVYQNL